MPVEPPEPESADGTEPPIHWWRPGWRDVAAQLGYGWLLLGAVALLTCIASVALFVLAGWTFFAVAFKVVGFLAGTAVCIIAYVVRRAIQARKEPFCIFCGYSLTGLPDHYRCPECGRAYTWEQIGQYRQDPQWFIERWKARQSLPPADRPVDTGPSRPRRRARDGTE